MLFSPTSLINCVNHHLFSISNPKMACFLYLFQGSKSWLALLLPILALFAKLSSGHGSLLVYTTLSSLLLVLLSTLFHSAFPIQKDNPIEKEVPRAQNEFPPREKHQTSVQEKTLYSLTENLHDKVDKDAASEQRKVSIMGSQDLYSESESMEQLFSSSGEEDHSSDKEWPYYNMEDRTPDCSDGSISDEESLIEIAIPSGQFVSSPDHKDHHYNKFNLKYCKLSAAQDFSDQEAIFKKYSAVDFLAGINEMNEEDNLIEIDIYMGSIKYSSFQI